MNHRPLEPLEPRTLLALVIDYPMEEGAGATVADAADGIEGRFDQDAHLSGGAGWITTNGQTLTGLHAVSLDGADDALELSENIADLVGRGSATVSTWIKTTAVGAPNPASSPALLGGISGSESILWGWIDHCGRIKFSVPGNAPTGGRDTVTSDFPINDGAWYHVAMTRDIATGEISLYVNGMLHDRALADRAPRNLPAVRDIGVVANDDEAGTRRYLSASIDRLRIYDEVLSDAAAATEFNPSGAPPASPANLRVTFAGARTIGLQWNHVIGTSGYEIWRSLADEDDFQMVALAPPKGSFFDSGLERSTGYAYRIRSVNPFGTSAFSETIIGTTYQSQWDPPAYVRGTEGDDQIRVEVRGQDVHVWNSASCCETPYRVVSLDDHDGIWIDALGGSDTIEVEIAAGTALTDQVTVSAGTGHDDVRITGTGFFILTADTGLDDLTLGGRDARVVVGSDQQFGSWVFEGPAVLGFYGTTSVRTITPHPDARIEIGAGTLRLLDSPERDLMLRRLETMAASARAAAPAWSGNTGLTSSSVHSPLKGIAVGIETKVTYNGDANGDGRINADDYFAIDAAFLAQPPDPLYSQGDFNYDGTINADDYFLIDQAFLGQPVATAQGAPLDASPQSASSFAMEPIRTKKRVRAVRNTVF